MGLRLVSAAASDPVSLAEAKLHLRVDTSEDDTLIEALISAAVDFATRFLGRALVDQTWDLYLDSFPHDPCSGLFSISRHWRTAYRDDSIHIPLPPLIEVLGVYYLDSAGIEQTFSPASYVVDAYSDPGRIVLTTSGAWPAPKDVANAVRVRFRAGYIDTSVSPAEASVPAAIKAAILLTVGDLYANREETVAGVINRASFTVERLLRPYRFDLSVG